MVSVAICALLAGAQPVHAGGTAQLSLEVSSACVGDSNGVSPGDLVTVELWMRNLSGPVTGMQAFVGFDPVLLDYRGSLSSYTVTPFPLHIQSIGTAELSAGELTLDASVNFGNVGVMADAKLATLIFQVRDGADCGTSMIEFRDMPPFVSQLSNEGDPVTTSLLNTPTLTFDNTPPIIMLSTMNAVTDGSCEAMVPFTATITDNCCLDDSSVNLALFASLSSGMATVDDPMVTSIVEVDSKTLLVTGFVPVTNVRACPVVVTMAMGARDCCNNPAVPVAKAATVTDVTAPVIVGSITGGDVDDGCERLVTFEATVTDSCCVNAASVTVSVSLATANATLGTPTINKLQQSDGVVVVSGSVLVSALTSCPAIIDLSITATDCCNNVAAPLIDMTTVQDVTEPVISDCPDDIVTAALPTECSAIVYFTAPTAMDNCDPAPVIDCVPPSGSSFPAGTTTVTCTATDACGNQSQCTFDVTVTAIHNRLELDIINPQTCYGEDDLICVELRMACLDQPVTGFNAFISFNADVLTLENASTSYSPAPFPLHISSPISAVINGSTGEIDLDGSVNFGDPAVNSEAVLATICFRVKPGQGGQVMDFAFRTPPSPTIGNELSYLGSPVSTVLYDTLHVPEAQLSLVPLQLPSCFRVNELVCVDLRMECNGAQPVTGFNAFIEYDADLLEYQPGLSSYTFVPFPLHILPFTTTVHGSLGQFDLDGSVNFGSPGVTSEATLATLCFRVKKYGDGTPTVIRFRDPPSPTIGNELSVLGEPIPTNLQDADIATANQLALTVCSPDDDGVICVQLKMECLQEPTDGFTAYLQFNNDALEFEPIGSGYTLTPFENHVNPVAPFFVGPDGRFDLDGSTAGPGVQSDALLATLKFRVRAGFEAVASQVIFRAVPTPADSNALTFGGSFLNTSLRSTPFFTRPADINLDGMIDGADVTIFVNVLVGSDIDLGHAARSDLNCDGRPDGDDIQYFVNYLIP